MNNYKRENLVVITRPIGRAEFLLSQCKDIGINTLHLPLFDIKENTDISGCLKTFLPQFDFLFFVSPTAVEVAKKHIDWKNFSGQLIATGKATAKLLAEISQKEIIYPLDASDSEAVLRLPIWQEKTSKILIIRGENGRSFLGDELRKIGWQVEYADIYRRVFNPINQHSLEIIFRQPENTIIVLTSKEAALFWCNSQSTEKSNLFKKLLYLTIHSSIGNELRQNGMLRVIDFKSEVEIAQFLRQKWS